MTPPAHEALAARLERMAAECESTEDAETGELATFVPGVVSGFFHDYLTDAAAKLRKADRLLAAADGLAEAAKRLDHSVENEGHFAVADARAELQHRLIAYQEARDGK